MSEEIDWGRTAEYWTIVGGVAAALTIVYGVIHYFRSRQRRRIATKLGEFLGEGDRFLRLPFDASTIEAHNDWVRRMESFIGKHLGSAYVVRLSNFHGMTFHGDGSEQSNHKNAVSGRARRLHEFIAEISNEK